MKLIIFKQAILFAATLSMAAMNGCAYTQVGATERGHLAKGVMQRDLSADLRELELHHYASKENTVGGYAIGGGGCGCN